MALYRTISLTFWTDTKIADDFTPEDRYFYLYLFTNPHTNLCGCYEVSVRQIANETGYSVETIERLLNRFSEIHKVSFYAKETKEVLLVNWYKYNWTKSEKLRKPLLVEINKVKKDSFREYLLERFEGKETGYPIDTYCIDTSVTVTASVTDTVSDTDDKKKNDKTPYKEVLDLYHSICVMLPKVRQYTDKRKKGVKARLSTYKMEDLKEAFTKTAASDFLSGKNDRGWKPDFEWFFIYGDNNIAKVLEGKYDNKGGSRPQEAWSEYDPSIFEPPLN